MSDVKVHREPVWRERANLILEMKADLTDSFSPVEQIPARRGEDGLFEICCIPFFIYDLSLGDRVQIIEQNGRNIVSDVVESSGHHTFRAWFKHKSEAIRHDVLEEAQQLGCSFEWFDNNLLALDAPDEQTAIALAEVLEAREEKGQLQYETGRTHA